MAASCPAISAAGSNASSANWAKHPPGLNPAEKFFHEKRLLPNAPHQLGPLFAATPNALAANAVVHSFISVVPLEGTRLRFSGLRFSHESSDNGKNHKHHDQIR